LSTWTVTSWTGPRLVPVAAGSVPLGGLVVVVAAVVVVVAAVVVVVPFAVVELGATLVTGAAAGAGEWACVGALR
jgi:hypothetical protein